MREKELKIYTSKECKYCDKLKTGLDTTDLKYIDIDVDDPDNSNEVDKIFNFDMGPKNIDQFDFSEFKVSQDD